MRLKSSIWVSAYVRRLNTIPVPAIIARRGDPDAGAIFIKVNRLDGFAIVLRPALSAPTGQESGRFWTQALSGGAEEETVADNYLARQSNFDTDMWIVEIEDRQGRHFLDEFVLAE